MNKKGYEVVGAIVIRPNNLELTIAELRGDGGKNILEELVQPTNIGSDVFQTGRIHAATISDTVLHIKGFKKAMDNYQVKTYKAVATSAFREAENQEYVLERIRMNTGIVVDVANSAQERFYMHKALRYGLPKVGKTVESALVVNVGSGGVEFSIYQKGNLMMTEYINIGALRLHEQLSTFQTRTTEFLRVMEEFISSRLSIVKPIINKADIQYFIGLGSELNMVAGLISAKKKLIDIVEIENLYEKIKRMQDEEIMEAYRMSAKQVETLVPTFVILNSFLGMTHSKKVYIPKIDFRQGIVCDLADSIFDLERQEEFNRDIISSVWYLAKKYGIDRQHSSQVAKVAMKIYDQTEKYHQLGKRERQYLEIAAMLHAIGYFVNFNDYNVITSWLVKRQNIMGISNLEMEIISSIIFYHEDEVPRQHHTVYTNLSHEEKAIVLKLTAILKIANSLDYSRGGKVSDIEICRKKDELILTVKASQNLLLEEWVFNKRAEFFEEVMGIHPVLKIMM
ncbi:Ppx/GppA phosphatase family protein [Parasporobacterium paucivorans]|uniref:Exopolyphosphatase / guanosine-5'-triphosphate,3'-diphosphate pyrophosphatase n=1 Tax=Parasporobacterium paucivorans DSM 15970 TaxID=1122934 RepID=A0A1M6JF43_9FIRM|nr:HD domain-containing protein [Parasporobacterium paucivorans]SHJ45311.1 exopolyphosphatase / guanosine-5'-triphosphate,3'-diphosphate pyrophosphatase [Parasporobacterium paucivorans DSM 15970]